MPNVSHRLMVACGAICERKGKILMVKEYRPEEGHVLNQPVGKLEFGESVFDATIREVREETGLDIELTYFLGAYVWLISNGNTSIRFCFVARVVGGELRVEPRTDKEIVQPVWLSREELRESENKFRNPVTEKCLDDYFAGIRHPLEVVRTLSGPPYFGD
jgi:ADP-ribose pyrophosphatase YjhB (NUDIX family)